MPAQYCYRVRQLPPHIRQFQEVSQLLSRILGYSGTIAVHSIASSIDTLEYPATKVATVTFEDTPETLNEKGKQSWKFLRTQTLLSHNIVIDTHFDGFTVLNEVVPSQHTFDCVAVSGLAGHAFGSWCGRDSDADFMWLRDALPRRFPNMRIISYGYDTQLLQSASFQTIPNLASAFVHQLHALGFFEPSAVPIIFVGHSLGGIVIKEALSQIANSSDSEDADRVFLFKVRQAMFFGVPNQGMMVSHLLPMVKGQANEAMIRALATGSPYLQSLDEQFSGLALTHEIDIASIYETHQSQIPKMLDNGIGKRDGSWEILVKPESAVQRGTKRSRTFEINKDHSSLVKFSETDASLGVVVHFMQTVYDNGHQTFHKEKAYIPTTMLSTDRDQGFTRPQKSQIRELVMEQTQNLGQRSRQSMMRSLYHHELDYRYSTVELAHASTLDWLFSRSEVELVEWIERGDGVFWIRGKPGSGKSTIMKHIINRYGNQLLRHDTQEGTTTLDITAHFFLFRRGTLLQKSYEGLLRALLCQILSKSEDLADLLLREWIERSAADRGRWSVLQLEMAWDALLRQSDKEVKITLFLDALDEFEGSIQKVVNFVQATSGKSSISTMMSGSIRQNGSRTATDLSGPFPHFSASQTHIRICFASRPWNLFRANFDECPGFHVERHTSSDILNYLVKTTLANRNMRPLLCSSDLEQNLKGQKLLSRIHDRAKGVFIWVKLVLNNILAARDEGATLDELKQVLKSSSDEIDALYAAILTNGSSREYRREAYVMLEVLVRSSRPLTPNELHYMTESALCGWPRDHSEFNNRIKQQQLSADEDVFERRVRSRCGGLIEFAYSPFRTTQLMHDTVRDFVTQPRFRDILLESNDPFRYENGHTFLARLGLAITDASSGLGHDYFVACYLYTPYYLELLKVCSKSYRKAEQTTGISLGKYLDRVSDQGLKTLFGTPRHPLNNLFIRENSSFPRRIPFGSRIIFALAHGLDIYLHNHLVTVFDSLSALMKDALVIGIVECFLSTMDSDITMRCLSVMKRLLIHDPSCIMTKQHNLSALQLLFLRATNHRSRSVDVPLQNYILPMVEVLLKGGSDPNSYIFVVDRERPSDFCRNPVAFTTRPLHVVQETSELTKILIDAGADVNSPDAQGRTPLDSLVVRSSSLPPGGSSDSRYHMTLREHCEQLISRGAKVTNDVVGAQNLRALVSTHFVETKAWQEFERSPLIKASDPGALSKDMLPRLSFLRPQGIMPIDKLSPQCYDSDCDCEQP